MADIVLTNAVGQFFPEKNTKTIFDIDKLGFLKLEHNISHIVDDLGFIQCGKNIATFGLGAYYLPLKLKSVKELEQTDSTVSYVLLAQVYEDIKSVSDNTFQQKIVGYVLGDYNNNMCPVYIPSEEIYKYIHLIYDVDLTDNATRLGLALKLKTTTCNKIYKGFAQKNLNKTLGYQDAKGYKLVPYEYAVNSYFITMTNADLSQVARMLSKHYFKEDFKGTVAWVDRTKAANTEKAIQYIDTTDATKTVIYLDYTDCVSLRTNIYQVLLHQIAHSLAKTTEHTDAAFIKYSDKTMALGISLDLHNTFGNVFIDNREDFDNLVTLDDCVSESMYLMPSLHNVDLTDESVIDDIIRTCIMPLLSLYTSSDNYILQTYNYILYAGIDSEDAFKVSDLYKQLRKVLLESIKQRAASVVTFIKLWCDFSVLLALEYQVYGSKAVNRESNIQLLVTMKEEEWKHYINSNVVLQYLYAKLLMREV